MTTTFPLLIIAKSYDTPEAHPLLGTGHNFRPHNEFYWIILFFLRMDFDYLAARCYPVIRLSSDREEKKHTRVYVQRYVGHEKRMKTYEKQSNGGESNRRRSGSECSLPVWMGGRWGRASTASECGDDGPQCAAATAAD